MKFRLPVQNFSARVLAAIGRLWSLGRPAHRDEAREFAQEAIEEAKERVVEEHDRENPR